MRRGAQFSFNESMWYLAIIMISIALKIEPSHLNSLALSVTDFIFTSRPTIATRPDQQQYQAFSQLTLAYEVAQSRSQ